MLLPEDNKHSNWFFFLIEAWKSGPDGDKTCMEINEFLAVQCHKKSYSICECLNWLLQTIIKKMKKAELGSSCQNETGKC